MTGTLATLLAILCMTLTGGIGVLFLMNPARGLTLASHRIEQLPLVMSDRYIGTAFLLLGAFLFGDYRLLAWFLAVVGIAGLGDVLIYARANAPILPHLIVSALYGTAATLSWTAHLNGMT